MKMKKIFSLIIAATMLCASFALTVQAAEVEIDSYYSTEYTSQKAKLDTMEKMYDNGEYEMYFDKKSGAGPDSRVRRLGRRRSQRPRFASSAWNFT